MASEGNADDISIELPSLEENSDPAGVSEVSLFSAESIASITSKQVICESLLKLVIKDCKFNDFIRDALVLAMHVIKCEAGSVIEVDHKSNTLFFRAVTGQSSDRLARFIIPMGKGIVGHVAESKQPMVVENVEANRQHLKAIQDAVGFETRNLVAYPVLLRGHTYGVIELLNRISEKQFSPADLELLQYFCDMFSRAIEARLMIAYQRRESTDAGSNGASGAKAA